MTEPVVTLAVAPAEQRRRQRCIEILELALAEAKEGRGFESVYVIGTFFDSRRIRQFWTGGQSSLDVVGRLEHLKHELLQDAREADAP